MFKVRVLTEDGIPEYEYHSGADLIQVHDNEFQTAVHEASEGQIIQLIEGDHVYSEVIK